MIFLYILLYILFGIILLVFLLLLIPFSVHILYDEEIKIKLKYAFIRYNIDTSKEKVEEETEKDVEKAVQDGEVKSVKDKIIIYAKKIIKDKSIPKFFSMIKELTVIIASDTYKIFKHIKIKELDIYFVASCEELNKTSMMYVKACATIYPFVNIVKENIGGKNIRASVGFDYEKKENVVIAETELSIIPLFALIHGGHMIIKIIPYVKKFKSMV